MIVFKFKVPVYVDGELGMAEVDAMRTDTPGILLTSTDNGECYHRLTHERTGMGLGPHASSDVFLLLRLAVDLGVLADWTTDGRTLAAAVAAEPRIKDRLLAFTCDPNYVRCDGPSTEISQQVLESVPEAEVAR